MRSRLPNAANCGPPTDLFDDADRMRTTSSTRVGGYLPTGPLTCAFDGSGGGTRTHNLRINSPPLCRLSYPGRWSVGQSTSGPVPARARGGRLVSSPPSTRRGPSHEDPLVAARGRRHRHRLHDRREACARTTPRSCEGRSVGRPPPRRRSRWSPVARSASPTRRAYAASMRSAEPAVRSAPGWASKRRSTRSPGTDQVSRRATGCRRSRPSPDRPCSPTRTASDPRRSRCPSVIQSLMKKHLPDSLYTAATNWWPVVARSGTHMLAFSGPELFVDLVEESHATALRPRDRRGRHPRTWRGR